MTEYETNIELSEEWLRKMAEREGDSEIGAGVMAMDDIPLKIKGKYLTCKYQIFTIKRLLKIFYEPDEEKVWWSSPQPLLDNELPIKLIKDGRGDEIIRLLRCMDEGAYI